MQQLVVACRIALLLCWCVACSAGAALTHARVADSAHAPVAAARDAIAFRIYSDAAQIRRAHVTPNDIARDLAMLRDHYESLDRAMTALILAYNAYVDAIRGAASGGDDARSEAARVLLRQWRDLVIVASAHGIVVASPLPELIELARATR